MVLENPGPYLTDPNDQEHHIGVRTVFIGRAVDCDIVVSSKNVSREHARIQQEGRRWFVEDMNSTNGTFLNDERVIGRQELRDGDILGVGDVPFTFHDPDTTVRENAIPDLEVDLAAGVVRLNRRAVSLSSKEYALLNYLYERRGQVCSKDDIGQAVWPEYESGEVFDYQIENLVRRLRTHIELDPADPQLLVTVRGLGYKLLVA